MGPLLVVTGTGTSIGKTHVSTALLLHASQRTRTCGYKPVESGASSAQTTDHQRLHDAGTLHVKHLPLYSLQAPVSPHLAARLEGISIDWSGVVGAVKELRSDGTAVLVEMPGGLFTPLTATMRNVDALALLEPSMTLLVAPDALAVLHDVGATVTAASALDAIIDGVVLVAPSTADASTGTNVVELEPRVMTRIYGVFRRAPEHELAGEGVSAAIVTRWLT